MRNVCMVFRLLICYFQVMQLAGEIASDTDKSKVKLVCLGIGTFEKADISSQIRMQVVRNDFFYSRIKAKLFFCNVANLKICDEPSITLNKIIL